MVGVRQHAVCLDGGACWCSNVHAGLVFGCQGTGSRFVTPVVMFSQLTLERWLHVGTLLPATANASLSNPDPADTVGGPSTMVSCCNRATNNILVLLL